MRRLAMTIGAGLCAILVPMGALSAAPVRDAATVQEQASSTTAPVDEPPSTVPSETTSSTTPSTTSSTTVAPGAPPTPSTTLPPTTVVGPPLDPKVLANNNETSGSYSSQPAFDPASRLPLPGKVAEATRELTAAQGAIASADRRLEAAANELERRRAKLDSADSEREKAVTETVRLRDEVRNATVRAFIAGPDVELVAMTSSDDPSAFRHSRTLLDGAIGIDVEKLRSLRRYESQLDDAGRQLAASIDAATAELNAARRDRDAAAVRVLAADEELDIWSSGTHVNVPGFVFPVVGPVQFVDTWGAPRMAGTAQAHWHEGTDVFAPEGAALVAVERGTIRSVGSVSLGGLRVWLDGDSGTSYYYAHLASTRGGLAPGTRVAAGDVIGTVGRTGNAATTPPHLHFEVHPGAGRPVNPYPLLVRAVLARADES